MRIRSIGELGLRIRDRRLELGWSQAKLADRVGTTRQWVVNLEQGNPGAGVGQVLQTLTILGLGLDVRELRTRKDRGGTPQRRARNITYDDVAAFFDGILQRARDPEPDESHAEPPQRTPLRRREEE